MSDLVDRLAQHIRIIDEGNELSGYQLGAGIATFLEERGVITDEATRYAIEDFTGNANTGVGYRHPKRLGGAALAEAIVAELDLDKEIK